MATERDEAYWLKGTIQHLQALVNGLHYELRMRDIRIAEQEACIKRLKQQVEELKRQAAPNPAAAADIPAFVKPNRQRRPRKKPGREPGHEAALRPMPARIDHHQDVPLTRGNRGESGAQAWAKLASLIRTADQKQLGVYEAMKKLVLEYWAGGGR